MKKLKKLLHNMFASAVRYFYYNKAKRLSTGTPTPPFKRILVIKRFGFLSIHLKILGGYFVWHEITGWYTSNELDHQVLVLLR